jgi:hypothetical protein
MIEEVKNLELNENSTPEDIEKSLEKLLELPIQSIKEQLSSYISSHTDKIISDIHNIIPYGDYGSIIEDKAQMAQFLKEQSSKIENWKLYSISENKDLLQLTFSNTSVDEGDLLKGHVFISANRSIKHLFAQID